MKYLASIAAVAGFAGMTAAQDMNMMEQMLLSLGLPQCSVKCVAKANMAAVAAGCDPTDSACACPGGKGAAAAQSTTLTCLTETNACPPDQIALLAPANDKICAQAGAKGGAVISGAPGTMASSPTSTGSSAGAATTSPASGAAPQQTLAAGLLGVVGLVALAL